MITIEKLKNVKKIISHKNCPDGSASAIICALAFKKAFNFVPEIEFVAYSTEAHKNLVPEPGIMFTDFTPPLDRWDEFKEVGTIVLDHHISAKNTVYGENVIFSDDNSDSGASLCYKHIYAPLVGNSVLNELSRLIMIRDTWKKDHEDWDLACCVSKGLDFFDINETIEAIRNDKFEFRDICGYADIGEEIIKRARREARSAASRAHVIERSGKKSAFYNNSDGSITSDIGEELRLTSDFSVGWHIRIIDSKIRLLLSFRSSGDNDVSKLASAFNGGGHKNASGGHIDLNNFTLDDIFLMIHDEFIRLNK